MLPKWFAYVIILLALIVSGCSASSTGTPVKSQISTYDTTFTSSVRDKARVEKRNANPLKFAFSRKNTDGLLREQGRVAKPYFIEFRARNALSYGHASVVFGKLRNGRSHSVTLMIESSSTSALSRRSRARENCRSSC